MKSDCASESRVVPLLDGVMELDPLKMFPGTTAKDWAPYGDLLSRTGVLVMPYGGFLVTTANGGRILVDAGGGPTFEVPEEMGALVKSAQLPASLENLGVAPDSINTVVLTHLHADHIGWLAPDGAPFFRNAEIHCHRADWTYFIDAPTPPDEKVTKLLAGCADRVTLWDGDCTQLGDLTLRHTPGHTPGSSIIMLTENRGPVAIVGDLAHTPAQFREQWNFIADTDPVLAANTRKMVKWHCATTRTALWANHFPPMRPCFLTEDHAAGTTTWEWC